MGLFRFPGHGTLHPMAYHATSALQKLQDRRMEVASQARQKQAVNCRDSDYGRKGQMARCKHKSEGSWPGLYEVERHKYTPLYSHVEAS